MTTANTADAAVIAALTQKNTTPNSSGGVTNEAILSALAEMKAQLAQAQSEAKTHADAMKHLQQVQAANKVLLRNDAKPEEVVAALRVVYADAGYGADQIEQEIAKFQAGASGTDAGAGSGSGSGSGKKGTTNEGGNEEVAALKAQLAALERANTQTRGAQLNVVFDESLRTLMQTPKMRQLLEHSKRWNGDEAAAALEKSLLEDAKERAYTSMKERVAGGRHLTEDDVRTSVQAVGDRLVTLMGQHVGDPTRLGRIPESGPDALAESLKDVPKDPPKIEGGGADQLDALQTWVGQTMQKMAVDAARETATSKV